MKEEKLTTLSSCHWGSKRLAAKILGISPETLKFWRKKRILIEGVHWVAISPTCVRYNLKLLEDWVANRATPHLHKATIEAYLQGRKVA